MANIAKTAEMLDLSKSIAAPMLEKTEYAWEALPKIKAFIKNMTKSGMK